MTLKEHAHTSVACSQHSTEQLTVESQSNDVAIELNDSSIAALISFFTLLDRWDREAHGNAEEV